DDCGACDVCLGEVALMDDALVTGQKILCCVVRLGERFGAQYTAAVLKGSRDAKIIANGHDRLSTYGLLKEHDERQVRIWTDQLFSQGCLEKDEEWGTLKVTPLGWRVIRGQATPRLIAPPAASAAPKAKRSAAELRSWDGVDRELFESLRALRLSLAKARGIPPYMVFGDATLRELARLRPATPEAFLAIHGIGERKNAEYGEIFRALIRNPGTVTDFPGNR
ncbi:MAG TPA: DNA helicase RecQ, partial [Planctomycetes bacterium]|nr:DNA helicase RecQ [Planctomycetota bacterium]